MNLIPNQELKRPQGKKQLDTLRALYMSSLAKRSLQQSNAPQSNESSSSLLSSEEDSQLSSVLQSCGCSDFLPQFRSEGITLDLIPVLEPNELSQLIPKLGPRKRLEQWIKTQKSNESSGGKNSE